MCGLRPMPVSKAMVNWPHQLFSRRKRDAGAHSEDRPRNRDRRQHSSESARSPWEPSAAGDRGPEENQRSPRRDKCSRRLGTRDVVLRNSRTGRARLPVLHLEMSRSVPHTSIGFHGSASFTQTSGRSDRGQ